MPTRGVDDALSRQRLRGSAGNAAGLPEVPSCAPHRSHPRTELFKGEAEAVCAGATGRAWAPPARSVSLPPPSKAARSSRVSNLASTREKHLQRVTQ
eukprot:scaffold1867_cov247-Pinguiococcus_pyrenoidosus.AAC.22